MVEQRLCDGPFEQEIVHRLGMMPNLFRWATSALETTRQFWQLAKCAYLDAPLPALFDASGRVQRIGGITQDVTALVSAVEH